MPFSNNSNNNYILYTANYYLHVCQFRSFKFGTTFAKSIFIISGLLVIYLYILTLTPSGFMAGQLVLKVIIICQHITTYL